VTAENIANSAEKASETESARPTGLTASDCQNHPLIVTQNAKQNAKQNEAVLSALIDAWPDLPDEARAGIEAILSKSL